MLRFGDVNEMNNNNTFANGHVRKRKLFQTLMIIDIMFSCSSDKMYFPKSTMYS